MSKLSYHAKCLAIMKVIRTIQNIIKNTFIKNLKVGLKIIKQSS